MCGWGVSKAWDHGALLQCEGPHRLQVAPCRCYELWQSVDSGRLEHSVAAPGGKHIACWHQSSQKSLNGTEKRRTQCTLVAGCLLYKLLVYVGSRGVPIRVPNSWPRFPVDILHLTWKFEAVENRLCVCCATTQSLLLVIVSNHMPCASAYKYL